MATAYNITGSLAQLRKKDFFHGWQKPLHLLRTSSVLSRLFLLHYFFFSRPYLSNGRGIGMAVVRRLSVRPSVCLFVCHGCIVAKRCEIGPKLLFITNKKSQIGFQMTYKSLTLNDLKRL